MFPYNYCVSCHEKPANDSHWCAQHKDNPTIYCSNCGTHLNPLLDHPRKYERQFCTGCQFASSQEVSPTSSISRLYMEDAIVNQKLPIHVVQAYKRHLA